MDARQYILQQQARRQQELNQLYQALMFQQMADAQGGQQVAQQKQPNVVGAVKDAGKAGKGILDMVRDLTGGAAGGATASGGLGELMGNGLSTPAFSEATQAAWNAGGDAATSAAAPVAGEAATSTLGTILPPLATAAIAAYTGKKAYDAYNDSADKGAWGGLKQGIKSAGALNFVPILGQAAWLGGMAGGLFNTDRFKTEGRRLAALEKKGINIPDALKEPMGLKSGRSKEQLVKIEQEKINNGQYGNTKFAESRNEGDLKAEDIWGYSSFFDKFGNDWLGKFSEQQRRDIANAALADKAVNERRGTIDINWNPDLDAKVKSIIGGDATPPVQNKGPLQADFDRTLAAVSGLQIPRTGKRAPDYKPGPRR